MFKVTKWYPKNRWPVQSTFENFEDAEEELVWHEYCRKIEIQDLATDEIVVARDEKGVWTGRDAEEANRQQAEAWEDRGGFFVLSRKSPPA